MTTVAFMGKADPSPDEIDLLETLGHLLATDGDTLIVPSLNGANGAIAKGWSSTAGTPTKITPKQLHKAAPQLIVYFDGPETQRILEALPENSADTVLIEDIDKLRLMCEVALSLIDEKGCLD